MPTDRTGGQWAQRAASLYDEDYARRYRDRDDELATVDSNQRLIDWLGEVCDRFDRPIDILDLGCGTGRYFWGLRRVKTLTGLDASRAMLEHARTPIHAERLASTPITLVEGDVMSHAFPPGRFDLVYSIGVLAEHVPLDRSVVERVHRWLRPGGRFAFTTVHPESTSIAQTLPRRLASLVNRTLPAFVTTPLHHRLVGAGLYADERWITKVLSAGFAIESLDRMASDVHLHARCVARKAA